LLAACGAESAPEVQDAGTIDGGRDAGCPNCACPVLQTQQVFTCDDSLNPLMTFLPAGRAKNCSYEDQHTRSRSYRFRETMDRQVTLRLVKWNDCPDCLGLGKFGDAAVHVFDGTACVGPAQVSSDGSISFAALANTDYTVVIESVGENRLVYSAEFGCDCPMGQTVLACNSTIVGTTSGVGASQLVSSWKNGGQTPLAPGPEVAYALRTGPGLLQHYDIRLTGASEDLDLFVATPEESGICDPHSCTAFSATPATSSEAISIDHSNLDVFVDSRAQGGPFQLEVDCSPACRVEPGNYFQCDQARVVRGDLWGISNTATWGSCAGPLDGAEIVYPFRPSVSGRYNFALTGMQHDLDLIVLPSSRAPGRRCDPAQGCLVSSTTRGGPTPEAVSFVAVAGEEYLLAVDGPQAGVFQSFELSMKSPACPALDCAMARASLGCPGLREERRGSHDPGVAYSLVDAWPCAPDTTGSEIIYELSVGAAGTYTVTLDELSTDLDLIVVRRELSVSPNFRCVGAATCAASSLHPGSTSEVVSLDLAAGEHVFVAVESRTETPGLFHIMLSGPGCP